MTEVPEHLLRRSQERRAALSGEAAPAAPAEAAAPAAAAPAAPAEEQAAAAVAVPGEAAVPAVPEEAPAPVAPPIPVRRWAIPVWVMPVLIALPIWALVYAYALDSGGGAAQLTPLQQGAEIFSANCASCHLANGAGDTAGGVGRQLNDGQVVLTFPDEAGHVEFVAEGSPPVGTPYGDPERPGGQHQARGGMPGFAGVLDPEELEAVVTYEREGLE